MTAKEYLNQLYLLDMKYQTKKEEIQDMRELASGVSGIRYDKDKVQTSATSDQLINAIIRITEKENEAMRIGCELADQRQKIIDMIIGMDDGNFIRILCLKYVHYKKLEDVATIMHYSYDWIKHLHGEALNEFERKYKDTIQIKLTTP